MKYFLLFSLLFSSLFAEAQIYIGSSIGVFKESIYDRPNTDNLSTARLKFGYGDIAAYAFELSLDAIDADTQETSLVQNNRYALTVAVLKAFDFDIGLNPFLKVGFGTGYYKEDISGESVTRHYGHYTAGSGIFIPLGNYFDLEAGYEYKFLSYENTNEGSTKSKKAHANQVYFGFNVRF